MAKILERVGSIFGSGTRLNLAARLPEGKLTPIIRDSGSIVAGGEDKEIKLD